MSFKEFDLEQIMRLCGGITSVEKNIKFMRGKQGGTHMFGGRSIVHQPRFTMYRNTYLSQSLYNINRTPPAADPPPPVTRLALKCQNPLLSCRHWLYSGPTSV